MNQSSIKAHSSIYQTVISTGLLLIYSYASLLLLFYTHLYKTESIYRSFAPLNYGVLFWGSFIVATITLVIENCRYLYRANKDRVERGKIIHLISITLITLILLSGSYRLSYQSMILGYSAVSLNFYKYGPFLILVPLLITIGLPIFIRLLPLIPSLFARITISFFIIPSLLILGLSKTLYANFSLFDLYWITLPPWTPILLLSTIIITASIIITPFCVQWIIRHHQFKHPHRLFNLLAIIAIIVVLTLLSIIYGEIFFPVPPVINAPTDIIQLG